MSSMMDQLEADAKKEKKESAAKAKVKAATDAKAKKAEISAEHGEQLIREMPPQFMNSLPL